MDEAIPLVLDDSLVLVLETALRMLMTPPSHFLLTSFSVIAVNFHSSAHLRSIYSSALMLNVVPAIFAQNFYDSPSPNTRQVHS